MFVNKESRRFSTYQDFDKSALELVPVRHRRLRSIPGGRLADMVTLRRRDRPVQHGLFPWRYQTHFTQNKLAPLLQPHHLSHFITDNSTLPQKLGKFQRITSQFLEAFDNDIQNKSCALQQQRSHPTETMNDTRNTTQRS